MAGSLSHLALNIQRRIVEVPLTAAALVDAAGGMYATAATEKDENAQAHVQ